MTQTQTRRRTVRAIAAGAAFTTALAVVAAVAPAQAVVPPGGPYFTYVDSSVATAPTLKYAAVDQSGPTALLPPGLRTLNYAQEHTLADAVSSDGSTTVVGVRSLAGPAYFDATFALVVTHSGVTRILHTYWDTNPVITGAAGAPIVWFLVHGNLYKYTWATNAIARVNYSGAFNPTVVAAPAHSYSFRLAVSPDGTKAAVMHQVWDPTKSTVGSIASDIQVRSLASTATPLLWQAAYTGTGPEVLAQTFSWTSNTELAFGACTTNACTNWYTKLVDVSGGSNAVPATLSNLNNWYGLRQAGGIWYAWQDDDVAKTATYATTVDPTFATPLTPSGNTWTAVTLRQEYMPSTGAPQAFVPVTRMGVFGSLTMARSLVTTGTRVAYVAYGIYPTPLTTEVLPLTPASKFYGGTLQSSTNGVTWVNSGTSTYPGSSTAKLYRNTWFRWYFAGDVLARPAFSAKSFVAVSPVVSVRASRSGASTTVYGATTRIGGTAILSRYYGRAWHTVLSTRITSKGLYSFGKRVMVKGSYRVGTKADASWVSGFKAFTLR